MRQSIPKILGVEEKHYPKLILEASLLYLLEVLSHINMMFAGSNRLMIILFPIFPIRQAKNIGDFFKLFFLRIRFFICKHPYPGIRQLVELRLRVQDSVLIYRYGYEERIKEPRIVYYHRHTVIETLGLKNGIAQAVIDVFAFIDFIGLENMRMSAYNDISSGIYAGFGYSSFLRCGNTHVFVPPVKIWNNYA